jgi:hypothetical protein
MLLVMVETMTIKMMVILKVVMVLMGMIMKLIIIEYIHDELLTLKGLLWTHECLLDIYHLTEWK